MSGKQTHHTCVVIEKEIYKEQPSIVNLLPRTAQNLPILTNDKNINQFDQAHTQNNCFCNHVQHSRDNFSEDFVKNILSTRLCKSDLDVVAELEKVGWSAGLRENRQQ